VARRYSRMLPLGTPAPRFALRDTVTGTTVALEDFVSSPALLIAFICNHCPFVKHILDEFVALARDFGLRGLAVVALSSNDVAAHPDDAPTAMTRIATLKGFTFPYLYDESQEVAKAYQASCTPDFFLFDRDRRLAYRGQFDGSRPGSNIPVTGSDLRAAAEALQRGRPVSPEQTPSVGCSIKWKAGQEPDWM
jgi:peroxiredoxin